MRCLVPSLKKEQNGGGRNAGVGKETQTRLGVQRVELVFGEHGRIRQGLADVLDLEVGKVSNDVRRRHPIRHEVDDVGHGYAEPTDARAAGQNLRVLGDAIKRLRHSVLAGTLPQVLVLTLFRSTLLALFRAAGVADSQIRPPVSVAHEGRNVRGPIATAVSRE